MSQPQDAKALIREALEGSMNQGSFDALAKVYAPDCVTHRPPYPDLVGLDALRKLMSESRVSYPDVKVTLEDVLVDGDRSAMRYTFRGTQKGKSPTTGVAPTGKVITYTACSVSRWKDGKIAETWDNVVWLGVTQQFGTVPKTG